MAGDAPKAAAIRLQFYFRPAGGTDQDFEKVGADCHLEITVYQDWEDQGCASTELDSGTGDAGCVEICSARTASVKTARRKAHFRGGRNQR
jgi:hypothetical protein